MYKFKTDKYQKLRGGRSRVLDITCEGRNAHITFYQKDGPGVLKRMYTDRFIDSRPNGSELTCTVCNRILGNLINYKKEDGAGLSAICWIGQEKGRELS